MSAAKFTFSNPNSCSRILKSELTAKVIGRVRVRVRFEHKNGQVDNFTVLFLVSKIDRGVLSKSLRVILVS